MQVRESFTSGQALEEGKPKERERRGLNTTDDHQDVLKGGYKIQ